MDDSAQDDREHADPFMDEPDLPSSSVAAGPVKLWQHSIFVALLAFCAALLSIEEPQFGDDFAYWGYGYNVHERGLSAWTDDGFHQLRWPIWGSTWLAQGVFGIGLASYYFVPFVMLMLGSVCAFTLGWAIFRRLSFAWGCAVLFMFHPIFDVNLTRPYPDVGEGVLGSCAVFAWWLLMHAETRRRIALTSIACGVCLFLAEENRLTGVFFIPLLGCLTLLFFRKRWLRLAFPLAVFALLLLGQMAFYHAKFGKWDHFLTANKTAKGRSGTEAVELVALYKVPLRFLGALHKGNALLTFNAIFGALGCWFAWRRFGRPGRVVLAWFVLLYLAYACAPQQLWPFRPMLRNADRFLSALVVPYTALTIMGLAGVLSLARQHARTRPIVEWMRRRPFATCALGTLVVVGASLAPLGDRSVFRLGYIPEMQAYLRALPANTTVFTHRDGFLLAHMMDHATASRLTWIAGEKWILEADQITPELAAKVKGASEFWYIRKRAIMRHAKAIVTEDEDAKIRVQPKLAPWFDAPETEWQLARVLVNSDNPDIVLYTRRTPATPPPVILTHQSPELQGLLPPIPLEWKKPPEDPKAKKSDSANNPAIEFDWPLPPSLRGKRLRLEMEGSSDDREPLGIRVSFGSGKKFGPDIAIKANFFSKGGKDFVCVAIPPGADTARVRLRIAKGVERISVTAFRLIAD